MKRLLVYLFLVLGLGLVVSVSADAKTYYCISKKNVDALTDREILHLSNKYYLTIYPRKCTRTGLNKIVSELEYENFTRKFNKKKNC